MGRYKIESQRRQHERYVVVAEEDDLEAARDREAEAWRGDVNHVRIVDTQKQEERACVST